MGGDRGTLPLVAGAVRAIVDDGARVILVGRQAELESTLDDVDGKMWRARITSGALGIVHADDVVTMADKPRDAVRKKRRSSMRVACDLVASGEASAAVSVGNSGAMYATALFAVGRLPGVARPAIATLLPSLSSSGRSLLVDAGANIDCEPLHLAQWGLLGSVYLERACGQVRPAVGVLSNGEEDTKGTPLVREALALLRQAAQQTDLNLVGFCEGRDLNFGEVDVIVTDGFTGNIVLKTAEGVFSFMSAVIKRTFSEGSVVDKAAGLLSQPGWAKIKRELDPREFGAAPLLGLRQPVFIAHGKSDEVAVRAAIRAARRFVDVAITDHLVQALARTPALAALAARKAADDDTAATVTGQDP